MSSKSEYTRNCISEALIRLLQKYPIDTITVSSLTKEANVSRSAFYNNYKSIEEVLLSAYKKAHHDAFHLKFEDEYYVFSDQYILDNIRFFDDNSKLLLAIYKWDLITFVAKKQTSMVIDYTTHYHDPIIQKNSHYFMCFSNVSIFYTCQLWVINGKQETPEELFDMIKYFIKLRSDYENIQKKG